MISAIEAKLLTKEVKTNNAKEWYKDFSSKLEEEIIKQIKCGCFTLIIDKEHKLNEFNWINCEFLRNKVQNELEELYYKFKCNGIETNCYIEITWK